MFTVRERVIIECPVTPGPLTRGARYRGDFKGVGVVEYEFAEYEPERRFTHWTSMKMGEMRHSFTFAQVPEGTRLTQEGHLTPNLLGWLLGPLMMAMPRKRFCVIASELNQYLASTPITGVAAPGRSRSRRRPSRAWLSTSRLAAGTMVEARWRDYGKSHATATVSPGKSGQASVSPGYLAGSTS